TLASGNTPNDVLSALKKDGIISFTNVPSYAQVRRSYLDSAAACAVSAQKANAEFLLYKTLTDGTKRYTISTPSGQDADASATTTDAACPGYKTRYDDFSSLLELVVLNVATTLDATNFTTTDGYGQTMSSRKLMTDAVRLDHFHAYETPSLQERRLMSAGNTPSQDDFSIELHEDDGMFIVFATPAFYKVNKDGTNSTFESVSVGGEDDSESGLIIQRRDGQRVRPVLKPDQVTLMVGTGYNQWVGTSEQLPAVMHAVRMPDVETTATQRLLRAWFGKMTLLPSYQRMLKQMDFDVHANTTTQYVQQGYQSEHHLLGCAPGRHLAASADVECNYKECSVKAGATAPSEGCTVVCNRSHSTDAASCSRSCSCIASSHSAVSCWMICVKNLDTCAVAKQSCSDQKRVCS
ncbi:Carbohydrate-binding protein, partial [Phytophthora megakarya]